MMAAKIFVKIPLRLYNDHQISSAIIVGVMGRDRYGLPSLIDYMRCSEVGPEREYVASRHRKERF
tara:strand:+ start:626 stop:820 length:195 start_codon:yes stop_codon:yes gene_type:complete